jgi:hypothetical protein
LINKIGKHPARSELSSRENPLANGAHYRSLVARLKPRRTPRDETGDKKALAAVSILYIGLVIFSCRIIG